jgi:hypothetical protein
MGRPDGSYPEGTVMVGSPLFVQGTFIIGSPVLESPCDAISVAEGHAQQSICQRFSLSLESFVSDSYFAKKTF